MNINAARAGVHTQSAPKHIAHTVLTRGRATIMALFTPLKQKTLSFLCDVPKMVIICSNAKKGRRERDKNSGAE